MEFKNANPNKESVKGTLLLLAITAVLVTFYLTCLRQVRKEPIINNDFVTIYDNESGI